MSDRAEQYPVIKSDTPEQPDISAKPHHPAIKDKMPIEDKIGHFMKTIGAEVCVVAVVIPEEGKEQTTPKIYFTGPIYQAAKLAKILYLMLKKMVISQLEIKGE